MSISGISSASSGGYLPPLQNPTQATTTPQSTTSQTGVATQAVPATQPDTTQQSSQVNHHHHHHGGSNAAAQSTDVTQAGTATAGRTNLLDTLV